MEIQEQVSEPQMAVNQESQQITEVELAQAIAQYKARLKQLSKNELVRTVVALTGELQRLEAIISRAREMAEADAAAKGASNE